MKTLLIKFLKALGFNITNLKYRVRHIKKQDILFNVNRADHKLKALLIYITHPFHMNGEFEIHQNFWQVKELARIFDTFGYNVDVVDYDNKFVKLKNNYDLVIGLIPRGGIDIYSRHLNPDAKKIAYLTSSNLEYTNQSEEKRLDDLFYRRGIRLKPRRNAGFIDKSIESFDAAFFIGNEYNLKSYDCFDMPPTYFIRNNGYAFEHEVNWSEKKANNFVFFGSAGQVHKGLDLLLEIFAQDDFPCNLYVCGAYETEKDFVKGYSEELFHRKNIIPVGFVKPGSEQFFEIMDKCAYSILPSCAEGVAGSVLTTMSAKTISIVSRYCGFADDDCIVLNDCTLKTIENEILHYSKMDTDWIKKHCEMAAETVKTKYSRRNFTESVMRGLNAVLGSHLEM